MLRPVVLCGGEGSRLRPLTYYFQKAMIPVGREQKPLLEYILRHIRFYGFEETVLLVGYKGEQVVNYFGDGGRVGLKLSYVWDDENVKGTCVSLLHALRQKAFSADDTLLVYYGDILTNLNLRELVNKHVGEKAAATLALSPRYQLPVGVAEVVNGHIMEMREKPFIPINVTIGILVLEASQLKHANGLTDIMSDLIPRLIKQGEKVAAYISDCFWYDVGSTEKYEKLSNEDVDRYLQTILK
ncbi:MAG: nucleotidyltransferase family protein [Candidatus Caldarchaeum sp.]|uniref:Nucleotidyltransferase family protein n=1 Tax=Caldiarchaeum subterraneum TaxID=311458 RepID=A0A7C5LC09_CALS0